MSKHIILRFICGFLIVPSVFAFVIGCGYCFVHYPLITGLLVITTISTILGFLATVAE